MTPEENNQTDLCNTCSNKYADCIAVPVYGIDDDANDIVIECNMYEMSEEEKTRLEFEEFKKNKAEKFAKEQAQSQRETYKIMVSEMVDDMFPTLLKLSSDLSSRKKSIYDSFNTAIGIKKELYNVKDDQNSHTFSNKEGTKRISVGYSVLDNYDDTVNEGIAKVRQYISSLANNQETERLVEAIMQLLSKDKKGNIKPSKVITLSNLADKSDSDLFKDGVKIIKEAYKPVFSKQQVRAEYKDNNGVWVNLPLGMTEA